MTPERYRQIGELYHAALEVARRSAPAFLDRACAGDEEMRREVESLIISHEEAADFIAAAGAGSRRRVYLRTVKPTH